MINISEVTISCFNMKKAYTNIATGATGEAASHVGLRICIVLHGGAVWEINKKCHSVQEGDIILLSEQQNRRFASYSEDGIELGVFILERQTFSNVKHFLFFLDCIRQSNGIIRSGALSAIILEAYRELTESTDVSYELLSALFTEFFIKAERYMNFKSEATVKIDKVMLKALDYIDAHITEKISLAEVAKLSGFTESSFSRHFTKAFGVTFKKYVMSKRIEHAISLLENTDYKVVDVALESGFDSISGFYDTFRKITGTTPNKFI